MRQLLLDFTRAPEPTFENFVPGGNGELLQSLRAAADGRPAERVVYVWGESGAGKSHLARAFAEAVSGRRGVRVSCLCPQAVRTDMVPADGGSAGINGILSPEQVAAEVVAVMRDEKFLVLPHPEVAKYFLAKAQDYDRWLGGMQKLYAQHMEPPA